MHPFKVTIENTRTGEIRQWFCSEAAMTLIRRALQAYKAAPAYLAERFRP